MWISALAIIFSGFLHLPPNLMLDISKFMNELKTKNPKIYAELVKIHY